MFGFDTFPIAHTVPALLLCGVLLVWQLRWPDLQERLFIPAALLALFFLRLPSIWFNNEINPDESQMITQAMTLAQDPVYFRSVDGTTGGPLDSYFLILPHWFRLPFDFITAHLAAFSLIALFLWLTYQTARLWYGEPPARLALLPFIFLLGLTQNGDFLHYNSELVAIVLLAGATLLLARQRQGKAGPAWLFFLGLLLGMVPFGKLQGVPLAAVIGLFVVIDILFRSTESNSSKLKQLTALVTGGVTFPLLFVLFLQLGGQFADFMTFYIEGNLNYATGGSQVDNLLHLPRFIQKGTEFAWLILLVLSMVALWSATRFFTRSNQTNHSTFGLSFLVCYLLATLYAITKTGSEYVHYLFFLMGPLSLLMANGWAVTQPSNLWFRRTAQALLAVYLLAFGIQIVLRYQQRLPLNPYPSDQQGGWQLPKSDLVKQIQQYAKPGEKLAVWGWRCDYYVQAQMPQAVAENHTIRSAFSHPMQGAYQQRYVQNFVRSFPPVFVDAVGSQNLWMTDRKTQGFEMIEPLSAFVAAHYNYIGLYNDARLYVRKDRQVNRISELHLKNTSYVD